MPSVFMHHDSGNNNLVRPAQGSEKYFEKFTNQIKISYANVNEPKNLQQLKPIYLKMAFKALFQLNRNEFKLNYKKYKLIATMDFKKDIEQGQKKQATYLQNPADKM